MKFYPFEIQNKLLMNCTPTEYRKWWLAFMKVYNKVSIYLSTSSYCKLNLINLNQTTETIYYLVCQFHFSSSSKIYLYWFKVLQNQFQVKSLNTAQIPSNELQSSRTYIYSKLCFGSVRTASCSQCTQAYKIAKNRRPISTLLSLNTVEAIFWHSFKSEKFSIFGTMVSHRIKSKYFMGRRSHYLARKIFF